jgi:TP901 family phage tail tape measure protein
MATYISGGGLITGTSLGSLYVRLTADPVQLIKAFTDARRAVEGESSLMAVAVNRATLSIASTLATLAAVAIYHYTKFNKVMTESTAIMGDLTEATRETMEKVARSTAKELGMAVDEVAKSYYYLASAGYTAEQSIAALPVVTKFAAAGVLSLEKASSFLTDSMAALGMKTENATKNMENMKLISDVLTKANIVSNASVEQFAKALTNKAAAAMKSFNVDIYQGVAALAALAEQGTKGEEAGEALAIVLRDLQRAALKQPDIFRQLGIAVYDTTGNLRNLADIFQDFERVLESTSPAQRRAIFNLLGFQDRSLSVMLTLIGTSNRLREFEKALRDSGGATEEVANKQLASLKAEFDKTVASLKDLGIQFGQAADPYLRSFIQSIRECIDEMAKADQQTGSFHATLETLVDLVQVEYLGFKTIWFAIKRVIEALVALGDVYAKVIETNIVIGAHWLVAIVKIIANYQTLIEVIKLAAKATWQFFTRDLFGLYNTYEEAKKIAPKVKTDILDPIRDAVEKSAKSSKKALEEILKGLTDDFIPQVKKSVEKDWDELVKLANKIWEDSFPLKDRGRLQWEMKQAVDYVLKSMAQIPFLRDKMTEVRKSFHGVTSAIQETGEAIRDTGQQMQKVSVQMVLDSQKVAKFLDLVGTPKATRRIQPLDVGRLLEAMTYESGGGVDTEKAEEMIRAAGLEVGGGSARFLDYSSPYVQSLEGIQFQIEQAQTWLKALEDLNKMELQLTEDLQKRKYETIKAWTERLKDLQRAQTLMVVESFQTAFDELARATENFSGKQRALYQAMFAASKAFALADAIVKIQQGVANAASLPFPANLAAMASVLSATASIISTIQSVYLEFGGGRAQGGPVEPGKVYLVGEKGPEFFTPETRGSIIPSDRVAGSPVKVVVNNYSGATTEVFERQEGVERIIEVVVGRVKSDLSSEIRDGRGMFTRSLETSYRLKRNV